MDEEDFDVIHRVTGSAAEHTNYLHPQKFLTGSGETRGQGAMTPKLMANIVKYVPPDDFFGSQILQNSISAGAPSRRDPAGELTTLPRSMPYNRSGA